MNLERCVALPRFLVRQGVRDFMVWDRDIHGPAVVDGHPVVGFTQEEAIKVRDALNERSGVGRISTPDAPLDPTMPARQPAPTPSDLVAARFGAARDGGQTASGELLTSAAHVAEKYRVRPDCPKCGMHMIVVNDFSLVPDKRTYECLRCGNVAEAIDLRGR